MTGLQAAIERERSRLQELAGKRRGVEWIVDGLPEICERSPVVRSAVLEGGRIRIDGEGELVVFGVRRFDLLGAIVFDEVAAREPGTLLATEVSGGFSGSTVGSPGPGSRPTGTRTARFGASIAAPRSFLRARRSTLSSSPF